ncbi:MAG TPA: hypothetical protein PKD04_09625, partial [Rhodocyclaceae bacterium]|nr:hypothetical protein [Rhodocyclaceae bacterium]
MEAVRNPLRQVNSRHGVAGEVGSPRPSSAWGATYAGRAHTGVSTHRTACLRFMWTSPEEDA